MTRILSLALMAFLLSSCELDSGSTDNPTVGTPTDGDGRVSEAEQVCTAEELAPVLGCAVLRCPEEAGGQIQALLSGAEPPDPAELLSCLTAECGDEVAGVSPGCIGCLASAGDNQEELLRCLGGEGLLEML